MKIKTLLSVIAILIQFLPGPLNTDLYSQGTDTDRTFETKNKLYVGVAVSTIMAGISNEGFADSIYLRGISPGFAFEAGYFFSKLAGISVGAELNLYHSKVSRASYSVSYDTVDNENESYQMQITGSGIIEDQRITFLSIPVCMNLRFGGLKQRFYIKGGICLNFPVKKTFESTGVFTYDGYYPAYPVTLKDLPSYGFPSDLDMSVSGDLKIKPVIPSLTISAGAIFNLSEILQLVLAVHGGRSFGNISGYETDPGYRLTSRSGQMNSLMAGSTQAFFDGFGGTLGLRLFLK